MILAILLLGATALWAQDIQKINLANEYFGQGDLDKAKALYQELVKKPKNIPTVHNRYLQVLSQLALHDEGEQYLRKLVRQYPEVAQYALDLGILYRKAGDPVKADEQITSTLQGIKGNKFQLISAAQYLYNKQETPFALLAYQLGREQEKNPSAYALELAEIHRRMSQKDEMISEYLNFATNNPTNLKYVKNMLQNLLTEEDDLNNLEQLLYDKIQKHPNESLYSSLLIWVNLQQQNFYGAFIQARALDKRKKSGGSGILDIGKIALENKDYKTAIRIFGYLEKEYNSGINYESAKRYLVKSREELVKNTFPVDLSEIRNLIKDYHRLVQEIGINERTMEAMRSQALLYAFYLDRKDSAISILQTIIAAPGGVSALQAQAKLDLGDIYLLNGEPWESTLLYSQVEKARKDQPLGYEAKLRNAKLSYYKGDFELAQGHLDILKLATSREIANNAMALSLLIQDNTVFDSTDVAMKAYADIELALFQKQRALALDKLDQMLQQFQGHTLTDEIYWLKANILLEMGSFEQSVGLLNQIVESYQYDILSDDAYFLMGTIYEDQLKDKTRAMEIYQDFLVKFPGSLHSAEARKRFRNLRGDFDQPTPQDRIN
jgi:tetratricopeptide (TPR) repeat protein